MTKLSARGLDSTDPVAAPSSSRRAALAVAGPIGGALPALAIALLPKCPACLGAYLAFASGLGLGRLRPGPVWAVAIAGTLLALALLGVAARRRRRVSGFVVACAGAALTLGGRALDLRPALLLTGVALLYAGALWTYMARPAARAARTCCGVPAPSR